MNKQMLEILVIQYGFACQQHEAVLRDSDPYSPHGAGEIKESSARMTSRLKDVMKFVEDANETQH
jgi:hypothetical protein